MCVKVTLRFQKYLTKNLATVFDMINGLMPYGFTVLLIHEVSPSVHELHKNLVCANKFSSINCQTAQNQREITKWSEL